MALSGHWRTLAGHLRRSLFPPVEPSSLPWVTEIEDPHWGRLRLSGSLSVPRGAQSLVVVVHGLGGSADSPYVVEAAACLVESGFACLRLNLRGADRRGEDIYHAGLTSDLEAALDSPQVASFKSVAVWGFSLGGHLCLRFAVQARRPEMRAVVAVCPPLDLAAVAKTIDRPTQWPYRRYLLGQLLRIYTAVAARRPVPVPLAEVRLARTFVAFDGLVIARRFGFRDAWDYYRSVSVGPHLDSLRIPGLLVASTADPMVPASSLRPFLEACPACLEVCWVQDGGHLGFPIHLDLGLDGGRGMPRQVAGWLRRQCASSASAWR